MTPALLGLAVNQWTSARHLDLGGYDRLTPVYVEYEGWFVDRFLPRHMLLHRPCIIVGAFLLMYYKAPELHLAHAGADVLNWFVWRF
ncbi:hypothetical protein ActroDRAFT_0142 [Actinospica robiniae DSM 44927]|uniref:Uncharacterized protein n=1 Tax=Actinospica robiniae DSM 44927 TaxID=479430 RepID=W9E4J8_9ACTN|nr:hypothetical protein ActroDRAFT_0142 [Actinospica robiniae DSM 44927]